VSIPSRAARAMWRWGPLVAYLAVIFVGSSIPGLPDPGVSDKTAHLAEYGVLGVLMVRGLVGRAWTSPSLVAALSAVLLCALYAASDEVHQLFVPTRQFDVFDMIADASGAALAAGMLWAWGIIRRFSAR